MDQSAMTAEDVALLESQTYTTLARWWCVLNGWGWPSGIPNPMTTQQRQEHIRQPAPRPRLRDGQIMDWIDRRIGHRLISWEWNKERMTLDEHEDFFRGSYGDDREAWARHDKRMMERIQSPAATFQPDAGLLVAADLLEDNGMQRAAELLRDLAGDRKP